MVAEFVARAVIKIDGTPLGRELIPLLEEICVDDKAQVPSMFTLTFIDAEHEAIKKSKAKIGSKMEIQFTPVDEAQPFPLISGEVTAIEADYDVIGSRAIIRGYDLSHRLHRGRHTETYVNATDSDIAKKVAKRHAIQEGKIDSTSVTYKHVSQAGVSDWDFISARAQAIGFEVAVVDGKFNFAKPGKANDASSPGTLRSAPGEDALVYGKEIIEFHPRITAAGQVKRIQVRGWDPEKKQEIVGSATAGTGAASLGALTPQAVAGKVKSSEVFVAVNRFLADQSDATKAAEALAEQIGSAFAEADGVAIGDPRIVAGKPVSIGHVADEFKGKWLITSARHVINAEGYRIYFSAHGRQQRSLLGLTNLANPNGSGPNGALRINGLAVGIVTNNDDSQAGDKQRGRVKVRFPWLADKSGQQTYESHWARVAAFGAGPDRGAVFIPEVDDEVLVGFENGDVNRPYVLGGLYNGTDKPNLGIDKKGPIDGIISGNKVGRRGFTSRNGHAIVFVDDGGQNEGVVIRSQDGKLKIEIKDGKEVHITGDPKVIVTAKQELTLESEKDLNIKAQGSIKLEGATGVEMKSNASFKVQGTQVEVKGSGPVSVSGNPIKLN